MRVFRSILSAICALLAAAAHADDSVLSAVLSDLEGDVAALTQLNDTLGAAEEAELQVLLRRIEAVANERPDLVDLVIARGLTSGRDVLRHQALWLSLARARQFTCVVDYETSGVDEDRLRDVVGAVISVPLYSVDAARRTISLDENDTQTGNRTLSLIGDNVHLRTFGNSWRFSGVFALSEDGRSLSGPADYRSFSTDVSFRCSVDLL